MHLSIDLFSLIHFKHCFTFYTWIFWFKFLHFFFLFLSYMSFTSLTISLASWTNIPILCINTLLFGFEWTDLRCLLIRNLLLIDFRCRRLIGALPFDRIIGTCFRGIHIFSWPPWAISLFSTIFKSFFCCFLRCLLFLFVNFKNFFPTLFIEDFVMIHAQIFENCLDYFQTLKLLKYC